jgi:hypothetical protein
MKKKCSYFGWKYWHIFLEGKIQWNHAQIPCQNVKNKNVLFILEHKYAQSHKKKKNLSFAQ